MFPDAVRIPTPTIVPGLPAFELINLAGYKTVWLSGWAVPTEDSVGCFLQTTSTNGAAWDGATGDYHDQYMRAYTLNPPLQTTIEAFGRKDADAINIGACSIGNKNGAIDEGFAFEAVLKAFNKPRNGWISSSPQHDRVNNFVVVAEARGHRRQQIARNGLRLFFKSAYSSNPCTFAKGDIDAWGLPG